MLPHLLQTLILIPLGRDETEAPVLTYLRTMRHAQHHVVLEDKHDAEEDDIGQYDQHHRDAPPLQPHHLPRAPVHLPGPAPRRRRADRVPPLPAGVSSVRLVAQHAHIHLDAVPQRRKRHQHRHADDHQDRDPRQRHAVRVINVAPVPEPERPPAEDERERRADDGDAPARDQSSGFHVAPVLPPPADLEVQRQRADEQPHDARVAAELHEGPRDGADAAGVHVVGRDEVVALLGACYVCDDESKLVTMMSRRIAKRGGEEIQRNVQSWQI